MRLLVRGLAIEHNEAVQLGTFPFPAFGSMGDEAIAEVITICRNDDQFFRIGDRNDFVFARP